MTGVTIKFKGEGLWGIGGGGIPDDGIYGGTIVPESVEYRGSRNNAASTKKLYFTVRFDSGYNMYDNVTLPSDDTKPGVEKAFARLLLATGIIDPTPEAVTTVQNGGLKGKEIGLDGIIEQLRGASVVLDFKRPRGEGDWKQVAYLIPSEAAEIQSGKRPPIKDDRAPWNAAPTGATSIGAKSIQIGATAPVTAQPPGGDAATNGVGGAVSALLSLG